MGGEDLRKEIAEQRRAVATLSLAVKEGKEKGTHLLHGARKLLARMLTVLGEMQRSGRSVFRA